MSGIEAYWENRGREKGMAKGKAEIIHNMLSNKLSIEEISDLIGISVEDIKEILSTEEGYTITT